MTALAVAAAALAATTGVTAASAASGHHRLPAFTQTNLVTSGTDGSLAAHKTGDADLRNPWGIAFGPVSAPTPLWVANEATGTSTLYRTDGANAPVTKLGLTVRPAAAPGLPAGVVYNDTGQFRLPDGSASRFLFSTLSGRLTAWPAPVPGSAPAPAATEILHNDDAAFTGLALASTPAGPRLYAANARGHEVRVYDGDWKLVDVLVDPGLPAPLAPYNVAVVGDRVLVTYAPPHGAAADIHGAIDAFSLTGRFQRRLVTGGVLEEPWGLAVAPSSWGRLAGALLVGNVDDGTIHAFSLGGRLKGTLSDAAGKPLVNEGLWGMEFGNGVIGTPDDLVVVAGIHEYRDGLLALIRPATAAARR